MSHPNEAQSPLERWEARLAAVSGSDVRLAEIPFQAQLDLRADPADADLIGRLGAAIGVDLPTIPNRAVSSADGARHVLWLGPDEWLIVGAPGTAAQTEEDLRAAVGAGRGAVVDVSANRTMLSLAGPLARGVLETSCSIDLHPRVFGPGSCAQTLVGRAGAILLQVSSEPDYRLLVRPSFAGYLAAWLLDAIEGAR